MPQRIAVDDHLRVPGVDRRVRDRRRGGRADKHGTDAADDVAAGDAGGPVRRQADPRARSGAPVPLLRQGHAGHDRADRAAVGQIGPLRFTGFLGWLVWLVVHLYYLIGFENRLLVMVRWAWYYFRLDRPVRSIVRAHPPRPDTDGRE